MLHCHFKSSHVPLTVVHFPLHFTRMETVHLSHLSQLHHHVSKHVQKAHDSVPQSAVSQGLLVASAGTLGGETVTSAAAPDKTGRESKNKHTV